MVTERFFNLFLEVSHTNELGQLLGFREMQEELEKTFSHIKKCSQLFYQPNLGGLANCTALVIFSLQANWSLFETFNSWVNDNSVIFDSMLIQEAILNVAP